MLNKPLFQYLPLLALVCLTMLTACSKDDDAKQEKRCKITKYTGSTTVIDVSTGETETLVYDLPITYDDNCNVLTRATGITIKDSCVYANGLMTEIHSLRKSPPETTSTVVQSYYLTYDLADQPVVVSLKANGLVQTYDSLFYQNGMLQKTATFKPYGPLGEFVKLWEKDFEYYADGNLKRVATYKFYPEEQASFYEEELFFDFTDIKNALYQSPFPDDRIISLCKNHYAKYERYDANQKQTAGANFNYSQFEVTEEGYLKSLNGQEIIYRCDCD